MSSSYQSIKVIILGDSTTGRTTMRDYCIGAHPVTEPLTLGASFVVIDRTIDSKNYRFQIWDLAVTLKPQQIRTTYFKDAIAGIVVFDVTNRQSFYSVTNWIETFWSLNAIGPVPTILVANKSDLRSNTSVPMDITNQFVDELSQRTADRGFTVKVIETSKINRRSLGLALNELWEDTVRFLNSYYAQFKVS